MDAVARRQGEALVLRASRRDCIVQSMSHVPCSAARSFFPHALRSAISSPNGAAGQEIRMTNNWRDQESRVSFPSQVCPSRNGLEALSIPQSLWFSITSPLAGLRCLHSHSALRNAQIQHPLRIRIAAQSPSSLQTQTLFQAASTPSQSHPSPAPLSLVSITSASSWQGCSYCSTYGVRHRASPDLQEARAGTRQTPRTSREVSAGLLLSASGRPTGPRASDAIAEFVQLCALGACACALCFRNVLVPRPRVHTVQYHCDASKTHTVQSYTVADPSAVARLPGSWIWMDLDPVELSGNRRSAYECRDPLQHSACQGVVRLPRTCTCGS